MGRQDGGTDSVQSKQAVHAAEGTDTLPVQGTAGEPARTSIEPKELNRLKKEWSDNCGRFRSKYVVYFEYADNIGGSGRKPGEHIKGNVCKCQ